MCKSNMIQKHLDGTLQQKKITCRTYQWKIYVSIFVVFVVIQTFSPYPSRLYASVPQKSSDSQETYVMITFGWGLQFFSWAGSIPSLARVLSRSE